MTYNIRLGIQHGLEAVAGAIRAERPDIVALQEVGRHWVMGPRGDTTSILAELVGLDHARFVPCIEWYGPAQFGHALLSRWPIAAPRRHRLPQKIDEPRAALVAQVLAPVPFDLIATHLSHVDDRHAQGAALLALAERLGPRALILGDLNEPDVDTSWLAGLLAQWADASPDGTPTFPSHAPERRIDYLLARGGTWTHTSVVANERASDHRPVVATLEWD